MYLIDAFVLIKIDGQLCVSQKHLSNSNIFYACCDTCLKNIYGKYMYNKIRKI